MYSCIQVTLVLILKTSSRCSLKVGRSYLLCECHSFRPLWNTIQSDLTQSEKSDLDLFMNHQVFCIFAQLCQFAFHSPLDSDSLSSVSIFWWTCENVLTVFCFWYFIEKQQNYWCMKSSSMDISLAKNLKECVGILSLVYMMNYWFFRSIQHVHPYFLFPYQYILITIINLNFDSEIQIFLF